MILLMVLVLPGWSNLFTSPFMHYAFQKFICTPDPYPEFYTHVANSLIKIPIPKINLNSTCAKLNWLHFPFIPIFTPEYSFFESGTTIHPSQKLEGHPRLFLFTCPMPNLSLSLWLKYLWSCFYFCTFFQLLITSCVGYRKTLLTGFPTSRLLFLHFIFTAVQCLC